MTSTTTLEVGQNLIHRLRETASKGVSVWGDLQKEAADAIEALQAENERLRVQLAGCGVAAMQNTESSKAQRVQKGSYGWSESYGDVCRAVDREIELRTERDALAAKLVPLADEGMSHLAAITPRRSDETMHTYGVRVGRAVEAAHGIQAKGG
jgi:hypothetical protein